MGFIRPGLYPHRTGGEDILNLYKVKHSLVEDVSNIYTSVLGGRLIFKGDLVMDTNVIHTCAVVEEIQDMIKEGRDAAELQCILYGHNYRRVGVGGEITCTRCGDRYDDEKGEENGTDD